MQNGSDEKLLSQLIAEIASQAKTMQAREPKIKVTDETPRKFYYDNESLNTESAMFIPEASIPVSSTNENEDEKDLYPKLCSYLRWRFTIYPKRINEKRSSNDQGRRGNMYLFPDIVGLEYCSYEKEILDLMNETERREKIKLYSYEVKIRITRNNVRECFFQTAANSTWANYGYLVAKEIDDDEATLNECKILASQFKLGLIKLDTNNPSEESKIIIQAPLNKINWSSMNRIASQNSDFTNYVQNIINVLKINKIHEKDWDTPIDEAEVEDEE